MTRISKFLFALLVGFTLTTAVACGDDGGGDTQDLTSKTDAAIADLTPAKD